jgi:hypothetical protein
MSIENDLLDEMEEKFYLLCVMCWIVRGMSSTLGQLEGLHFFTQWQKSPLKQFVARPFLFKGEALIVLPCTAAITST